MQFEILLSWAAFPAATVGQVVSLDNTQALFALRYNDRHRDKPLGVFVGDEPREEELTADPVPDASGVVVEKVVEVEIEMPPAGCRKALRGAIESLGGVVPDGRAGYRKLVEALVSAAIAKGAADALAEVE